MKNVTLNIIIILLIFLALMFVISTKLNEDNKRSAQSISFNSFFEQYEDEPINGSDVRTIINKASDLNAQNENVDISIDIIFIMIDDSGHIIEKKSNMEALKKAGLDKFTSSFSKTEFKINGMDYDSKGRINNITIKQTQI